MFAVIRSGSDAYGNLSAGRRVGENPSWAPIRLVGDRVSIPGHGAAHAVVACPCRVVESSAEHPLTQPLLLLELLFPSHTHTHTHTRTTSCRPEEVLGVSPDFIQELGLKQSLTPSRNNGFLNMLKMVQRQTAAAIV